MWTKSLYFVQFAQMNTTDHSCYNCEPFTNKYISGAYKQQELSSDSYNIVVTNSGLVSDLPFASSACSNWPFDLSYVCMYVCMYLLLYSTSCDGTTVQTCFLVDANACRAWCKEKMLRTGLLYWFLNVALTHQLGHRETKGNVGTLRRKPGKGRSSCSLSGLKLPTCPARVALPGT